MKLKEFIEENGDRKIADIEVLEKCLEPKKPKTIWNVEKNDVIVHLSEDGKLCEMYWNDNNFHRDSRALGFEFLTEEEAEARAKMLWIETQLLRLGGRREFKSSGGNWYLEYDLHLDELIVKKPPCGQMRQDIYFDTKEDVAEAIDVLGSQRIINEYFKPRVIEGN